MTTQAQRISIGVILLLVGIVAGFYFGMMKHGTVTPPTNTNSNTNSNVNTAPAPVVASFDECVAAGYPVQESYPRQCRTPQGGVFVEYIGNELEKQDLVRIASPRPNQTISSPLVITGQARGYWYFEATFPVALTDADGTVLAEHYAQAQGDWMTEDFVPFTTTLTFTSPVGGGNGFLILKKDNPSGLPENEDELRIPVKFAP